MPKYPVFTSYAQDDFDDVLEKFMVEFRAALRRKVGAEKRVELVFFDGDGVRAGEEWSNKISEAIRRADVMLCLMSPTYFNREWCSREFELFRRRQDLLPDGERQFIFPIWWEVLVAPRPLPESLSRLLSTDKSFPEDYPVLGAHGLMARFPKRGKALAAGLAARIAKVMGHLNRPPLGAVVKDIESIPNPFDEAHEYDVLMVTFHPESHDWSPSVSDVSVREAAMRTMGRLEVVIRPARKMPDLAQQLQVAQNGNQVILVVADAAKTPTIAMRSIDALTLPNLCLLLVDTETPSVGMEAWLARLDDGAFAAARKAGFVASATAGKLQAQMQLLVDHVRLKLSDSEAVAKAEDSGLAKKATTDGIAIDAKPTLEGPGGNP